MGGVEGVIIKIILKNRKFCTQRQEGNLEKCEYIITCVLQYVCTPFTVRMMPVSVMCCRRVVDGQRDNATQLADPSGVHILCLYMFWNTPTQITHESRITPKWPNGGETRSWKNDDLRIPRYNRCYRALLYSPVFFGVSEKITTNDGTHTRYLFGFPVQAQFMNPHLMCRLRDWGESSFFSSLCNLCGLNRNPAHNLGRARIVFTVINGSNSPTLARPGVNFRVYIFARSLQSRILFWFWTEISTQCVIYIYILGIIVGVRPFPRSKSTGRIHYYNVVCKTWQIDVSAIVNVSFIYFFPHIHVHLT